MRVWWRFYCLKSSDVVHDNCFMTTACPTTTTGIETIDYTVNMARRQRTAPQSVDAFGQFTSDWDIIYPEDVFVKRSLKSKLQSAILKAATSILEWKSSSTNEAEDAEQGTVDANEDASRTSFPHDPHLLSQPDDETVPPASRTARLHSRDANIYPDRNYADPPNYESNPVDTARYRPPENKVEWLENRPNCVFNLLFPLETYHILQERHWLPQSHGHFRLTYELDINHLIVHLASPAHDAASNAFNFGINLWSANGGVGVRTLRQLGEGQWRCNAGAEKSPDQSFVPIAITCPPAVIIPGTFNGPYPTMVIEVSKTNESYQQLFDNADTKHFSNATSIQIWVGVKLYPGHGGRMRCMFRLRDQANGGILAGSGATTDFISLDQPTTVEFIIPKARVFWGVNPPLPPTPQTVPGPNALPPPPIPGTATDDLVLPLEELRSDAKAFLP